MVPSREDAAENKSAFKEDRKNPLHAADIEGAGAPALVRYNSLQLDSAGTDDLWAALKVFERSNDGNLDMHDLQRAAESLKAYRDGRRGQGFPVSMFSQDMQNALRDLDTDGSGEISAEEVGRAATALRALRDEKRRLLRLLLIFGVTLVVVLFGMMGMSAWAYTLMSETEISSDDATMTVKGTDTPVRVDMHSVSVESGDVLRARESGEPVQVETVTSYAYLPDLLQFPLDVIDQIQRLTFTTVDGGMHSYANAGLEMTTSARTETSNGESATTNATTTIAHSLIMHTPIAGITVSIFEDTAYLNDASSGGSKRIMLPQSGAVSGRRRKLLEEGDGTLPARCARSVCLHSFQEILYLHGHEVDGLPRDSFSGRRIQGVASDRVAYAEVGTDAYAIASNSGFVSWTAVAEQGPIQKAPDEEENPFRDDLEYDEFGCLVEEGYTTHGYPLIPSHCFTWRAVKSDVNSCPFGLDPSGYDVTMDDGFLYKDVFDSELDQPCNAILPSSARGYCECGSGFKVLGGACAGATDSFTCKDRCKAESTELTISLERLLDGHLSRPLSLNDTLTTLFFDRDAEGDVHTAEVRSNVYVSAKFDYRDRVPYGFGDEEWPEWLDVSRDVRAHFTAQSVLENGTLWSDISGNDRHARVTGTALKTVAASANYVGDIVAGSASTSIEFDESIFPEVVKVYRTGALFKDCAYPDCTILTETVSAAVPGSAPSLEAYANSTLGFAASPHREMYDAWTEACEEVATNDDKCGVFFDASFPDYASILASYNAALDDLRAGMRQRPPMMQSEYARCAGPGETCACDGIVRLGEPSANAQSPQDGFNFKDDGDTAVFGTNQEGTRVPQGVTQWKIAQPTAYAGETACYYRVQGAITCSSAALIPQSNPLFEDADPGTWDCYCRDFGAINSEVERQIAEDEAGSKELWKADWTTASFFEAPLTTEGTLSDMTAGDSSNPLRALMDVMNPKSTSGGDGTLAIAASCRCLGSTYESLVPRDMVRTLEDDAISADAHIFYTNGVDPSHFAHIAHDAPPPGKYWTFFHVARYAGDAQERIFASKGSAPWYDGFNEGKSGVSNHFDHSLTENEDFHGNRWVLSTSTETSYRSNMLTRRNTRSARAIERVRLLVNAPDVPDLASDFQIAEVLVLCTRMPLTPAQVDDIERKLFRAHANLFARGHYTPREFQMVDSNVWNDASPYGRHAALSGNAQVENYDLRGAVVQGSAADTVRFPTDLLPADSAFTIVYTSRLSPTGGYDEDKSGNILATDGDDHLNAQLSDGGAAWKVSSLRGRLPTLSITCLHERDSLRIAEVVVHAAGHGDDNVALGGRATIRVGSGSEVYKSVDGDGSTYATLSGKDSKLEVTLPIGVEVTQVTVHLTSDGSPLSAGRDLRVALDDEALGDVRTAIDENIVFSALDVSMEQKKNDEIERTKRDNSCNTQQCAHESCIYDLRSGEFRASRNGGANGGDSVVARNGATSFYEWTTEESRKEKKTRNVWKRSCWWWFEWVRHCWWWYCWHFPIWRFSCRDVEVAEEYTETITWTDRHSILCTAHNEPRRMFPIPTQIVAPGSRKSVFSFYPKRDGFQPAIYLTELDKNKRMVVCEVEAFGRSTLFPAGSEGNPNIALGAVVSASTIDPAYGDTEMLTDGNLTTCVSTDPKHEGYEDWMRVDLRPGAILGSVRIHGSGSNPSNLNAKLWYGSERAKEEPARSIVALAGHSTYHFAGPGGGELQLSIDIGTTDQNVLRRYKLCAVRVWAESTSDDGDSEVEVDLRGRRAWLGDVKHSVRAAQAIDGDDSCATGTSFEGTGQSRWTVALDRSVVITRISLSFLQCCEANDARVFLSSAQGLLGTVAVAGSDTAFDLVTTAEQRDAMRLSAQVRQEAETAAGSSLCGHAGLDIPDVVDKYAALASTIASDPCACSAACDENDACDFWQFVRDPAHVDFRTCSTYERTEASFAKELSGFKADELSDMQYVVGIKNTTEESSTAASKTLSINSGDAEAVAFEVAELIVFDGYLPDGLLSAIATYTEDKHDRLFHEDGYAYPKPDIELRQRFKVGGAGFTWGETVHGAGDDFTDVSWRVEQYNVDWANEHEEENAAHAEDGYSAASPPMATSNFHLSGSLVHCDEQTSYSVPRAESWSLVNHHSNVVRGSKVLTPNMYGIALPSIALCRRINTAESSLRSLPTSNFCGLESIFDDDNPTCQPSKFEAAFELTAVHFRFVPGCRKADKYQIVRDRSVFVGGDFENEFGSSGNAQEDKQRLNFCNTTVEPEGAWLDASESFIDDAGSTVEYCIRSLVPTDEGPVNSDWTCNKVHLGWTATLLARLQVEQSGKEEDGALVHAIVCDRGDFDCIGASRRSSLRHSISDAQMLSFVAHAADGYRIDDLGRRGYCKFGEGAIITGDKPDFLILIAKDAGIMWYEEAPGCWLFVRREPAEEGDEDGAPRYRVTRTGGVQQKLGRLGFAYAFRLEKAPSWAYMAVNCKHTCGLTGFVYEETAGVKFTHPKSENLRSTKFCQKWENQCPDTSLFRGVEQPMKFGAMLLGADRDDARTVVCSPYKREYAFYDASLGEYACCQDAVPLDFDDCEGHFTRCAASANATAHTTVRTPKRFRLFIESALRIPQEDNVEEGQEEDAWLDFLVGDEQDGAETEVLLVDEDDARREPHLGTANVAAAGQVKACYSNSARCQDGAAVAGANDELVSTCTSLDTAVKALSVTFDGEDMAFGDVNLMLPGFGEQYDDRNFLGAEIFVHRRGGAESAACGPLALMSTRGPHQSECGVAGLMGDALVDKQPLRQCDSACCCSEECASDPASCVAWTYVNDADAADSGACYLFTSDDDVQLVEGPGRVSDRSDRIWPPGADLQASCGGVVGYAVELRVPSASGANVCEFQVFEAVNASQHDHKVRVANAWVGDNEAFVASRTDKNGEARLELYQHEGSSNTRHVHVMPFSAFVVEDFGENANGESSAVQGGPAVTSTTRTLSGNYTCGDGKDQGIDMRKLQQLPTTCRNSATVPVRVHVAHALTEDAALTAVLGSECGAGGVLMCAWVDVGGGNYETVGECVVTDTQGYATLEIAPGSQVFIGPDDCTNPPVNDLRTTNCETEGVVTGVTVRSRDDLSAAKSEILPSRETGTLQRFVDITSQRMEVLYAAGRDEESNSWRMNDVLAFNTVFNLAYDGGDGKTGCDVVMRINAYSTPTPAGLLVYQLPRTLVWSGSVNVATVESFTAQQRTVARYMNTLPPVPSGPGRMPFLYRKTATIMMSLGATAPADLKGCATDDRIFSVEHSRDESDEKVANVAEVNIAVQEAYTPDEVYDASLRSGTLAGVYGELYAEDNLAFSKNKREKYTTALRDPAVADQPYANCTMSFGCVFDFRKNAENGRQGFVCGEDDSDCEIGGVDFTAHTLFQYDITAMSLPEREAPFQKTVRAFFVPDAEDMPSTAHAEMLTTNTTDLYVIVTGELPLTAFQAIKLPEYVPLLILRDPPGSESFATWTKGSTHSVNLELEVDGSDDTHGWFHVTAGFETETEAKGGLTIPFVGAHLNTDVAVVHKFQVGTGYEHESETHDVSTAVRGGTVSMTAEMSFSTAAGVYGDSDGNSGSMEDLFVVPSLSIRTVTVLPVIYDEPTCTGLAQQTLSKWELLEGGGDYADKLEKYHQAAIEVLSNPKGWLNSDDAGAILTNYAEASLADTSWNSLVVHSTVDVLYTRLPQLRERCAEERNRLWCEDSYWSTLTDTEQVLWEARNAAGATGAEYEEAAARDGTVGAKKVSDLCGTTALVKNVPGVNRDDFCLTVPDFPVDDIATEVTLSKLRMSAAMRGIEGWMRALNTNERMKVLAPRASMSQFVMTPLVEELRMDSIQDQDEHSEIDESAASLVNDKFRNTVAADNPVVVPPALSDLPSTAVDNTASIIAFSGGSGSTTYVYQSSRSRSLTLSVGNERVFSNEGFGYLELRLFGIGGEMEGGGGSGEEVSTSRGSEREAEVTTTVEFTLSDETTGDQFDVRIRTDPVYGTPIFETLAGRSMCPHEWGTDAREQFDIFFPRDRNDLDMSGGTLSRKVRDVERAASAPAGTCASFDVEVQNLSPFGDVLDLTLEVLPPEDGDLGGLSLYALGRPFYPKIQMPFLTGYGEKRALRVDFCPRDERSFADRAAKFAAADTRDANGNVMSGHVFCDVHVSVKSTCEDTLYADGMLKTTPYSAEDTSTMAWCSDYDFLTSWPFMSCYDKVLPDLFVNPGYAQERMLEQFVRIKCLSFDSSGNACSANPCGT